MSAQDSSQLPELPVVDLTQADIQPGRRGRVAVQAAERTGAFYVRPDDSVLRAVLTAHRVARAFFALPLRARARVEAPGRPGARGWSGLPAGAGDFKENFFCASPLEPCGLANAPMQDANRWPAELPELQAVALHALAKLIGVGRAVVELLAHGLEADPTELVARFSEDDGGALRLLRYPPTRGEDAGRDPGVAPHTDHPALALLAPDDVGGLEQRVADGRWGPIPPRPGLLVCQIGDTLARWSGDRLRANVHRVINRSDRDRYCVAFFLLPRFDAPWDEQTTYGESLRAWLGGLAGEAEGHVYASNKRSGA